MRHGPCPAGRCERRPELRPTANGHERGTTDGREEKTANECDYLVLGMPWIFGITSFGSNETFPFQLSVAKVKNHANRQTGDPEVIEDLPSLMIRNPVDYLGNLR
jgi:hypothetical protein